MPFRIDLCFLLIIFLKVETTSAQLRILRVTGNEQRQPSDIFPFNSFSSGRNVIIRVAGDQPRMVNEQNVRSDRPLKDGDTQQQMFMSADPFGPMHLDMLPTRSQPSIIAVQREHAQMPSRILPDHLRSKNFQNEKQPENVTPPDTDSMQLRIPTRRLNPSEEFLQSSFIGPFDSPFHPGLFQFLDGDIEPGHFLLHPNRQLMHPDMLPIMNQNSRFQNTGSFVREHQHNSGHQYRKTTEIPRDITQTNSQTQQLNQPGDASMLDIMMQNKFSDAMAELQQVSKFSKPLLRKTENVMPVSFKPDASLGFQKESTTSMPSPTKSPKMSAKNINKLDIKAKESKKNIRKSIKKVQESPKIREFTDNAGLMKTSTQNINTDIPRMHGTGLQVTPKVVQLQIESNRPGLTKEVIMDLLTNSNVKITKTKGNLNKVTTGTSLLSLLTGQNDQTPFRQEMPNPLFNENLQISQNFNQQENVQPITDNKQKQVFPIAQDNGNKQFLNGEIMATDLPTDPVIQPMTEGPVIPLFTKGSTAVVHSPIFDSANKKGLLQSRHTVSSPQKAETTIFSDKMPDIFRADVKSLSKNGNVDLQQKQKMISKEELFKKSTDIPVVGTDITNEVYVSAKPPAGVFHEGLAKETAKENKNNLATDNSNTDSMIQNMSVGSSTIRQPSKDIQNRSTERELKMNAIPDNKNLKKVDNTKLQTETKIQSEPEQSKVTDSKAISTTKEDVKNSIQKDKTPEAKKDSSQSKSSKKSKKGKKKSKKSKKSKKKSKKSKKSKKKSSKSDGTTKEHSPK